MPGEDRRGARHLGAGLWLAVGRGALARARARAPRWEEAFPPVRATGLPRVLLSALDQPAPRTRKNIVGYQKAFH